MASTALITVREPVLVKQKTTKRACTNAIHFNDVQYYSLPPPSLGQSQYSNLCYRGFTRVHFCRGRRDF